MTQSGLLDENLMKNSNKLYSKKYVFFLIFSLNFHLVTLYESLISKYYHGLLLKNPMGCYKNRPIWFPWSEYREFTVALKFKLSRKRLRIINFFFKMDIQFLSKFLFYLFLSKNEFNEGNPKVKTKLNFSLLIMFLIRKLPIIFLSICLIWKC
jgi:hypothetical protein